MGKVVEPRKAMTMKEFLSLLLRKFICKHDYRVIFKQVAQPAYAMSPSRINMAHTDLALGAAPNTTIEINGDTKIEVTEHPNQPVCIVILQCNLCGRLDKIVSNQRQRLGDQVMRL
jgi:predicted dinucleotide-utilizing enzyme